MAMDANKKRRRNANNNNGVSRKRLAIRPPPPGRLGWLGDGMQQIIANSNNSGGEDTAITMAVYDDDDNNNDGNAATSNDGWVCHACTLLNMKTSSTCDACSAKRRAIKSSFKSIENEQRNVNKITNSRTTTATTTSSITTNTTGTKGLVVDTNNNYNNIAAGRTMMWIDKYAPQTSQELCVAPKKVEQVRSFLSSCIEYTLESRRHHHHSYSQQESSGGRDDIGGGNSRMENMMSNNNNTINTPPPPPETKLMILIGNPGVGKSAMVRTLAREMNIQILAWNDAHVEYNTNNVHQRGDSLGSGPGYYNNTLPYHSQLNSFDEFLSMSGVLGMHSLDIVGGDDDADATVVAMGATTCSVASSPRERKNGRSHQQQARQQQTDGQRRKGFVASLILVEEIPNLYNAEAALSFRNIMERHIRRTQIPTIFIYSDVHEGNHKPEDLERLFPALLLYSPLVQMISIQPVTKSKMKKCLQSIAKAELMGTTGGSIPPSLLSAEDFEDMHLASGGDLRHAILAMQFRYCSMTSIGRIGSSKRNNSTRKDAKLSTFHALGKLLYAKRKQQSSREVAILYSDDDEATVVASKPAATNIASKWYDRRGPLEFVPEDVLSRIEMGIGPALSFLSYHSPDFFTDITDMCRSYDLLSDAVIFVDRFTGQQSDGPFPDEYSACIGGRAVADANKHPAPPQFRQFSAPKLFSVMKKSRENETKIELLRKRLSMVARGVGQQTISIHETIGSAHQFITDSLPYMRIVIPQDVNFALANLHSLAKYSMDHEHTEPQAPDKDNFVLLEDDLVDDDDLT